MIKFFRHIRRSLINENKMSKYFKYAIGEILLVVLGILIALQINNWNENRKNQQKVQEYYSQLLSDFNRDTSTLNFNIKRLEKNIEAYDSYINKLKVQNLPLDTIWHHMKKIEFTSGKVEFNMQTFEAMESTGDLNMFPSELRNALMALNTNQISYKEIAENNDKVYIDLIKTNPLAFKDTYLNELKLQPNLYKNFDLEEQLPTLMADLNQALRFKNFNAKVFLLSLNNILNQTKELQRMINDNQ